MQKEKECIFCKMVLGKMPCHTVWESDSHVAFLSIFPNTEGFTVVIPKKHYGSYAFAEDDAVLLDLILAAKQVARLLDRKLDDVGRTGLLFEGFGVDHLHAKLFPMHGTADMDTWRPIENKRTEFYEQYPGFISSHDSARADDKKLELLARKIRGDE